MIILKKIWAFLKTHWYIPLIIIAAILLKSQKQRLMEIVDIQKNSFEKQKEAIESAAIEKEKRKAEIEKEHQRVLISIEKAAEEENRTIKEKEKKLVKKLVKKYYNSPKELSEEISKVFGLTHVENNTNSSD
tara:strand:+ start:1146 stop:1541 length:396 start_codon:yes stop_codon:yes gene_type:complete